MRGKCEFNCIQAYPLWPRLLAYIPILYGLVPIFELQVVFPSNCRFFYNLLPVTTHPPLLQEYLLSHDNVIGWGSKQGTPMTCGSKLFN